MYKNVILPASLLAATIIGAGVFALPFVFEKAGLITGLFYLIIFGILLSFLYLMYADVIINTEEVHRFVGYIKIYLGKSAERISIFTSIIGLLISMVVYLVLAVSFIHLIAPTFPGLSSVLIFWLVASLAVFLRVRRMAFFEFLVTAAIVVIVFIIFFYGISNLPAKISSLTLFNPAFVFLPYGVVLFALSGRVAIPSVVNYFRDKKDNLTKSKLPIVLGTLTPAAIYLVFVLAILSLSSLVSPDSVSGLMGNLPPIMLWLLGILGFLSLWSTYIVISQEIERSLEYDFNFHKVLSRFVVIFVPIVLYFSGFNNFLALVSIAGGVFISFESILIVWMWLKAFRGQRSLIFKKLNPALPYFLILIFVVGIVYALTY